MRKILLNWMPWLLRMKRPGHVFGRHSTTEIKKETETESLMSGYVPSYVESTVSSSEPRRERDSPIQLKRNGRNSFAGSFDGITDPSILALLDKVRNINVDLKFITQRMKRDDDEQEAKNDWK